MTKALSRVPDKRSSMTPTAIQRIALVTCALLMTLACDVGPVEPEPAQPTAEPEDDCQDPATAGQLDTPCDADDCAEGLVCDHGCTDFIVPCGGRCREPLDPQLGCREGECDANGECPDDLVCQDDGFCHRDDE